MSQRRTELLALSAVLLYALILRIALINRPFHRDPEGCGSFYGLLARNYWRYDWHQTLGVPVMSMGIVEKPTLYPNHPPLVPLLIAATYGAAGYRSDSNDFPPDWLVRLPTVPFTLGCIVMIWWMLRKRASPRAALISAALFAAMPMTIVYGGQPDVINPQLVFFILLTVAAYLRFVAEPGARRFAGMCLAFLPAALTDWPAFFLPPVLCGHFALTRPRRQWGWMLGLGVVTAIYFLIPYMQVVLVTGEWTWMNKLIERRALSSLTDTQRTFTISDWIQKAFLGHAVGRHTLPVMILATLWLIGSVPHWKRRVPGASVAGILLAWAFLHIVVGRQGVFVHEWWWWPLTPAVAVAAGLMVDQLLRWLEARGVGVSAANSVVAVLLVGFAIWNPRDAFTELRHPARISQTELDYSIIEMGAVIRNSTTPNSVVLLAESDQTLSLWYYADRPIRYQIWDAQTLERRLADGSSDLCFKLIEHHAGRGEVLVLPKAYAPNLSALLEHLDARYPRRDAGKFLVFDLSKGR